MALPAQPLSQRKKDKPSWLARIAARLENRPDSEHEMCLNRVLVSGAVLIYLFVAGKLGSLAAQELLQAVAPYYLLFGLVSVLIFLHLLWKPGVSVARRVIAIPFDLFLFSYLVHSGDATTALLYPVYLWTIFGNGFRFGIPYLAIAAATGAIGFAGVILTTTFWQAHVSLGCGLLAGLIILPAYVSVLIRKLSEAKAQAEEASHAKSLFLASVSHELRTPLNAIIGFSDLLSDSALDDEQADMTQTIGRSGRSLLALINSILDFSRFEVGKMPVTRENIDLFAFLNDIRDMLTVQAQTKGIRLALHIGCRVPRRVLASRRLFEEVLINLAGNAVKFTAQGHLLISVEQIDQREGHATLRFEVADTGIGIAHDAQARIFESFTQADASIIDRFGGTGLGLAIAKQQVEAQGGRIGVESLLGAGSTFWFEIEFDTEPAVNEPIAAEVPVLMLGEDDSFAALLETAGAKLGRFASLEELLPWLVAAAQDRVRPPIVFLDESGAGNVPEAAAARLLEGEIGRTPRLVVVREANSPPLTDSQRALFSTEIRRPIADADIAAALAIASDNAGKRQVGGGVFGAVPADQSLRVLVAEDNRTNQKVIAKILERAGHRVQLVDNGQEAVEALAESPFDIVLMDVNMPVLNGVEATRRYRAATAGEERIPILALTADATADARARCIEAGMDDCVTKPIEPARLIELIHEFCPDGPKADTASFFPIGTDAAGSETDETSVAVDFDALAALDKLGGRDFVKEIVLQFTGDAATVLRGLSAATANDDLELFRDRAHALRSCAANVGAQAVYRLCLSWREIDAQEFALHGRDYMMKLEAEFAIAREVLAEYISDHDREPSEPPAPRSATTPSIEIEANVQS